MKFWFKTTEVLKQVLNEDYDKSGAKIIEKAEDIFKSAEIIVKVKEPQMNEVKMIRENQIIYTYLHLAAAKELTEGLVKSKSVCIAYETVTDDDGKLKGEDRCHLNGLCCVDGKPRYVTSSSRGDVLGHWRTHKSEGVVYDIVENKIVCEDVYSPHSPRWYNGKLWLLESGTGQFGYVDIENKEFVPKVFLPGFLRGLTFYGNYAIIGLSMERRENAFVDLPLHEELISQGMEPTCGFRVINMKDFTVECELNISPNIGVSEIYDVVCLPGYRSRVLQTGSQDSFKTYDAVFDPKKIQKNDVISSDIFDTTIQRDPVNYIKPDIEELKKELSEVEGFEEIDNMLNEDLEKSQSNLGQMHAVRKMNKLKKENEEKKKKNIEKEMDEDPYFSSNDTNDVFEPIDLSKLLSD